MNIGKIATIFVMLALFSTFVLAQVATEDSQPAISSTTPNSLVTSPTISSTSQNTLTTSTGQGPQPTTTLPSNEIESNDVDPGQGPQPTTTPNTPQGNGGNGGNGGGSSSSNDDDNGLPPSGNAGSNLVPLADTNLGNEIQAEQRSSGFLSGITGAVVGVFGESGTLGIGIFLIVLGGVGLLVYNRTPVKVKK
ncbi:MAG: hypothetical protein Q8P57_02645 [Candidatus Pacearchaeota archaeon]|nr:hypothetical protein [Candidatus Pacearchaeota archaeon]